LAVLTAPVAPLEAFVGGAAAHGADSMTSRQRVTQVDALKLDRLHLLVLRGCPVPKC